MADATPKSQAEANALIEEAEAEAAEAEALAAAARARARAARVRREALNLGAPAGHETVEAAPPQAVIEPTPARRWKRILTPLAKAAAIILILGFATASGYIMLKHQETTPQEQRTAAFAAGARQGVLNLTSLDFTRAKEDVQRVIDSSTGEFRDQFQQRAADF